ncbi:MAG: hypothetical protein DI536_12415 [Archangium gephyra]|uniref:Uncharacterized protein n=1 Tax=Archangium gephyra TaxID=48 RepID=A0A2W5TDG3_9BACT|nr:MAG: hypothetical protein DI536_12415 [Archangium gephyra]
MKAPEISPSAAFEKQLSVALPKWGDGAIEVKLGLSTVKLKPVTAREGSKLEHDGAYAVFAEQFTSKRRLLQRTDWRPHGPPRRRLEHNWRRRRRRCPTAHRLRLHVDLVRPTAHARRPVARPNASASRHPGCAGVDGA